MNRNDLNLRFLNELLYFVNHIYITNNLIYNLHKILTLNSIN